MRNRLAAIPGAIVAAALLSIVFTPSHAAATPAVQWRELLVPSRSAHAMVWDSRRHRALMFGGDIDADWGAKADGIWQLVRGATPHWEPLAAIGTGPLPRSACAAVYDSLRDRVLVFGGRLQYSDFGFNDLWSLSLSGTPAWTPLDVSAGPLPSPRAGASLILDAEDRLVLFGGEGATFDPDVWVLALDVLPLAWVDVPVAGPGPGPRARHGAVYSRATNRMTVFGGDLKVTQPNGVFDYVLRPAETWELALDAPMSWIKRSSAPADSVPLPETGGPFVTDPSGLAAWLVPGDQGYNANDPSIWRLDLVTSSWTRVYSSAPGPGLRAGAAAWLDPASGELLLHGGASWVIYGLPGYSSNDTWRFSESAPTPWSLEIALPSEVPPPTYDKRVEFDAPTRRLFTWTSEGVWTSDLDLDGAWHLDAAGATNAPPYKEAVSVIDPVRRRLLVFGGSSVVPDHVWSWPLDGPGAWTVIATAGRAPAGIYGTQRVYDALRDRVIVLPAVSPLDSITTLELSGPVPTWVRVATAGGPPPGRKWAAVSIDATRDRLVMVGGSYPTDDGWWSFSDLWMLTLSGTPTWTLGIPSPTDQATKLALVSMHGLVLDPTQDRLILIAGLTSDGTHNTLFATSLADFPGWTNLDPDSASPIFGGGVAFLDPAAGQALFWNGTLWGLTWPGFTSAPPKAPPAHGLALAPPRPNPARDHVTFVVETASAGEVTLEVFDTAGRRVGETQHGHVDAGRSEFDVPLPHGLAPGVYLVRARQGACAAHVRLAVTR